MNKIANKMKIYLKVMYLPIVHSFASLCWLEVGLGWLVPTMYGEKKIDGGEGVERGDYKMQRKRKVKNRGTLTTKEEIRKKEKKIEHKIREINHRDKKQVKLLYFANRRQQSSDIFACSII